MRSNSLRASSALCSAAFVSALTIAIPANGQAASDPAAASGANSSSTQLNGGDRAMPDQSLTGAPAASAAQADGSDENGQDIVVTGSRIRRPNLDSPVPVTVLSGDAFFQTGRVSVGDTLNQLPALVNTFSQSNSSRFLGTAGLSLADLRGLGTERTLVLVNGRRHVAGDILNNATSTDLNTIPTDLIERVDTVTGGNSAIYGSDAIAGVVNFVLKDNFRGFELRGQGGISQYGDAGNYYVSALAGTNFADNRGNIALNVEYSRQNDFYASQRKRYRTVNGFVQVDSDPAGATNGSDGTPDYQYFRDIRSAIYSNGGSFLTDEGGDYYNTYLFQPNGDLIPQTGERVGLAPYGSFIGGNGSTFREGTQLGLLPRLDRYSANIIGHFEVSPAFVPFVEATYVRTNSLGNSSGPFFFSGGTTGSPRESFYTDNPYLSTQARGLIRDYYGLAPGEETTFSFIRNVQELSNREEAARRETYRAVGGVRGTFNDDWSYEVSANYGEFDEHTKIKGNVNLQRFLLSIDAVDQGLVQNGVANGNVVCRSQVDPNAAVAFEAAANPDYAAAQLANDVSTCVPVNLFGEGNISQAAKNYLLQDSTANGKITQFVASAFLSGDTSQFLNLPGGPVGFAIGAEYRHETARYNEDEATAAGLTFYNAIPPFQPPSFAVKEAYGELRLPLLKNVPFFQELTASGAFRVADYKGSTGTVQSYNGGVEWAPISDIRFRGNYSRAVRAPNLVNSYTPLGQNYSLVDDPCSARNIGAGSSTRAANCTADGVPAGYDFVYQQSLAFLSGGNIALKAETSDSYTFGGVLQPRFLPGFSLTVDYYDITVNKVITSPAAQDILDACYDAANLDNQFCTLFSRYTGTGTGPRGEEPGQILENSLQVVPLNYAKLKVRGIDFDAAYRRRIGNVGELNLRGIYTLSLQNDTFLSPTDPGRADQQLNELGYAKHRFIIDSSIKSGPITLGYKVRYISKMVLNEYEDFFSKQGRPPQNADYAAFKYYPDVFYHDVRLGLDATEKFEFYFGIDNLTNRLPPLGLTGTGFGSGIYNNVGRFFYAGATAKF